MKSDFAFRLDNEADGANLSGRRPWRAARCWIP